MPVPSGSICLVTSAHGHVTRSSGTDMDTWQLAPLLADTGWEVHVLCCGSAEDGTPSPACDAALASTGIGFSTLDRHPDPRAVHVGRYSDPPVLCRSSQVRVALEALHRAHRFDLIQFADQGALGFRAIQAKRAGLAFTDV